jgi:hypothetical protein
MTTSTGPLRSWRSAEIPPFGRRVDSLFFNGPGGFVGTPNYMSPEQADTGGVDVDTRTYSYALGETSHHGAASTDQVAPNDVVAAHIQMIRRSEKGPEPSPTRARVLDQSARGYLHVLEPGFPLQEFEQHSEFIEQACPLGLQLPPPARKAETSSK